MKFCCCVIQMVSGSSFGWWIENWIKGWLTCKICAEELCVKTKQGQKKMCIENAIVIAFMFITAPQGGVTNSISHSYTECSCKESIFSAVNKWSILKTLLGLKIITVIDFADIVLVMLYFCIFLPFPWREPTEDSLYVSSPSPLSKSLFIVQG